MVQVSLCCAPSDVDTSRCVLALLLGMLVLVLVFTTALFCYCDDRAA